MIRYLYKNVRSKTLKELDDYKAGAWVYVEDPTDQEFSELIDRFKLDPGHMEDAKDQDEMPRLEKEGDYTYLFSRYAYVNEEEHVSTSPILFVIGPELFMTFALSELPRFERFTSGRLDFSTTQRTKLVLQIMGQIVDQYESHINTISRQIKAIRSRLRVEEIRNQDFIDFVQIEDALNEFLSALTPTNAMLRRILLGKHIPLYADDEDIVEDLLLNNEQSIEACVSNLKTIVNIRESYATIMANNLNQVIRILTVVTVVISVPTLISSMFGMNVGLPYQGHAMAFSGVLIFSLLVTVILLLVFKNRRWL